MKRHQGCLYVIYSCGLRLQEGTHHKVADIDSNRQLIHFHNGKGAKDRYVPLPDKIILRRPDEAERRRAVVGLVQP